MRTLYDPVKLVTNVAGNLVGGLVGGNVARPNIPSASDAAAAENKAAEEAARKAEAEASDRQGRAKSLIASGAANGTSALDTRRRSLLGSA